MSPAKDRTPRGYQAPYEAKGHIILYTPCFHRRFLFFQNPLVQNIAAIKQVCCAQQIKVATLDGISASILMDIEFEPCNMLIDNLIGRGIYLIIDLPKIDKSWLMLSSAVCSFMAEEISILTEQLPDDWNAPCSHATFFDYFKKAFDASPSIRVLTPHSCRHTYVSQIQTLGVDLATI